MCYEIYIFYSCISPFVRVLQQPSRGKTVSPGEKFGVAAGAPDEGRYIQLFPLSLSLSPTCRNKASK